MAPHQVPAGARQAWTEAAGACVIGADVGRAAMQLNRTLMLLGVSGLLGCATSGVAPGKTYTVPLTAAAEAPPCGGAGATASGSSTIVVAADDASISATVSYGGLSGDPTAAHIHSGPVGSPGPVVLPFSGSLTSPFAKTFTAKDYVAASGAPPDWASFVAALRAGNGAYVNLHTAACKLGEIRGDIQ